ncbi:Thiamine biosynthesis lipoprotein ApbE precursor [Botrimarina colliarenosi]|uniref:FAD:protein FMN transferase n=1 Tax=Botrimarina colliarenosi TaxID=2528001 RepID=A0A5C6ACQ3_9BACT|nr:FAD:protein FMN transferase [Botrimarina colliarenosi]TWT96043.1 Thiamine biosynthesis lipoprotein ApbE precursor [Botrimarina colliarenosi]
MADPQHSRRDFLRGRAALAAAADAVEAVLDAATETAGDAIDRRLGGTASPETIRRGPRTVTLSRRAMACDFELMLADENAVAQGMAALDRVERLEDQLTVYRDDSELVDLNRRAASERVAVEPRLFSLLELCGRIHTDSEGAFDPTSGPLSRVWGFHRREGRMPSDDERRAALGRVGWRHVELDATEQTVRFTHDGVEINVNSIGKGYALDRVAEDLAEREVHDSLMHGGRSTLLARGDDHLREGGGWLAAIRNPLHPQQRLAEFVLRDEALSTSGSGTQFFEHEGRRYGHLIDPRTGWPAEGLYSATVIAPTAAEADALSTAAYLLGVEGTRRLCGRRPGLRALLLAPEEEGVVAVHAINLEDSAWRPASA